MEKLTALGLAEKIRQRQISVLDGVKSVFAQIEKKEGRVHAYLDIYRKDAYARARQVEKGIAEGRYAGPLAGVPVAVKDNICIRGKKTTCASKILENFVPQYQAEAADRLEKAGLVLIGKTNMDEFAMGSTTETSAFGITRNPWNTRYVSGGSSGGSCAAVAAGEAYLALGSDTGGSIRQPSAFCGVTGLKPTYGTVSRYGLVAYASSLDQIGPIGKDTADCAALLEVIAGHDGRDSTSLRRKDLDFSKGLDDRIAGMRFGVPKEYLAQGLDPGVKTAFMEALQVLTRMGAVVEFFSLKTTEYMIPAYYIIASAEASSNLERFDGVKYGYRCAQYEGLHEMYRKTRTEGFGEEVKRRIMLGSFVLSSGYYDAYYLKALKTKALIKQEFDKCFEKYDVLLAPASPRTAPVIGESLKDPLAMYLGDIYTVAVNLCGLPAISVPCGRDARGLPIGIQMIGGRFMEKKILRAAHAYEQGRGTFGMPGTGTHEVQKSSAQKSNARKGGTRA